MFTFDETEGIFTADYNNNEDIIAATAAKVAYDCENGTNSMIWLADGDYVSHATNSTDDITAFLQAREVTNEQIVDGLRDAIDYLGIGAFGVSAIAQSEAIGSFAGKLSTGATSAVVGINLFKFLYKKDADTLTDTAISAVGFIPTVGPLFSMELALMKEGAEAVYDGFIFVETARRKDPMKFFQSLFSLGQTYTIR